MSRANSSESLVYMFGEEQAFAAARVGLTCAGLY